MRHRNIDLDYSSDLSDIYNACMNKNYLTRPSSGELLGLPSIQKWAKELGILNH
jgi:hypothetical protein